MREPGVSSGELAELLAVAGRAAAARGIDLLGYQVESLERGLNTRLSALELDPARYAQRLSDDPHEVAWLLGAVAVPTTEFFRDKEVFEVLADHVLPQSLASWAGQRLLRAWVVGSASGEEAWSLAMLLGRATTDLGVDFSVLATDIDARQVERARGAAYSIQQVGQIPRALLRKYVHVRERELAIDEGLQRRVAFATHDVVGAQALPREAIMATFHVVTLRNVLIYFGSALQQRALRRVAAVLRPGGVLVLGLVERIPRELEPWFEVFPGTPARLGIYRRRGAAE